MKNRVHPLSPSIAFIGLLLLIALMSAPGPAKADGGFKFERMWPNIQSPSLSYNPEGLAVDASGNVYVADSGNDCIHKFNSNGEFISNLGEGSGDGLGELNWPHDIAITTEMCT